MLCLMIMSCQRDQVTGVNDACRRTFLRQWPVTPYRFFVGGPALEKDEVCLNAPDNYEHLQFKQRAAYQWALDMVTHVFVSFTDTYIHIPRLMTCGYEEHDYMGLRCKHGEPHLSGGNGYFLSKRALKAILDRPPLPGLQGDQADYYHITSAGFATVDDHRFGDTITRHLSRATGDYDQDRMFTTHEELRHEQGYSR